MGYFNYFIKCVIRKFVNMIFKPKMFLALLIIIGLLFAMNITARAEWTDTQILQTIEDLESIAGMTYNSYKELEKILESSNITNNKIDDIINNKIPAITDRLEWINGDIVELQYVTQDIYNEISNIINQLTTLNNEILNIYNSLEENQQELLTELEKDNQAVLDELNMIRDSINGSDDESTTFTNNGIIHSINSSNGYETLRCMSIDYEKSYTYTVTLTFNNPFAGNMFIDVYYNDNLLSDGYNFNTLKSNFIRIGTVPPNTSNYIIKFEVPSNNPKYIYYTWGKQASINVTRKIKGLVESLNQSNSLQQQQNQLQQQQNQLQQEQNNFLKDDNVNTEGLEFATDDTVNPTDDGFNTLFMSIYNAFCSTSSQPLTVTLPYVNQTFTIQPNLVSNAMQKMRPRCCSKFN